jgi:tetratricopeptide (TPR) repeat protein
MKGWSLLLAAALATVAPPALARDVDAVSDADKAIARELVAVGDEHFAAGDYERALEAYRGADTIMGVPTTSIEVARTLAALGRDAEALAVIDAVLAYPERDDEPAAFRRARANAAALKVDLLERAPRPDAPAPLPPRPEAPPIENERTEADPGTPIVWTGLAFLTTGVIVGSITGGLTLATMSEVDESCDSEGRCPEEVSPDIDRARILAHVSTGSFAVAGAGAVLVIVGLLVSLDDDDADAPVSFTPNGLKLSF